MRAPLIVLSLQLTAGLCCKYRLLVPVFICSIGVLTTEICADTLSITSTIKSQFLQIRQRALNFKSEATNGSSVEKKNGGSKELKSEVPISPIGIASYRNEYDNQVIQEKLIPNKAKDFQFQRFQSPSSIEKALRLTSKHSIQKGGVKSTRGNRKKKYNNFTFFYGKDGRKGYVSSKKLSGDWVLAQSKQVAKQTTTKDVLIAYLNGSLQERWNQKEVLKCNFTCRDIHDSAQKLRKDGRSFCNTALTGKYYQQDLVLRSQRVITSETGIMKYTQSITIDQVGEDSYCVIIRLSTSDDDQGDGGNCRDVSSSSPTKCKPFDSLLVHVGLEQNGNDVNIYADGIMKVNRKVVPNLIVFDASGIAGSMAGKGTLWLGAHFEQEKKKDKRP